MTMPQCRKYESCSAPLCPLDEQSLDYGIWYPDEEVCTTQAHAGLTWIKAQKKIVKAGAGHSQYYKFEMLNRGCIIRKGIAGLDPDKPEDFQLKRWMEVHPAHEKSVLSEEHKKALRQGLERSLRAT